MAMGPFLLIVTLNVNVLNAPKQKTKTGWMDTKARPPFMLSTRDPTQNKGHIQTESEGLEKKYLMQMKTTRKQESQYSY